MFPATTFPRITTLEVIGKNAWTKFHESTKFIVLNDFVPSKIILDRLVLKITLFWFDIFRNPPELEVLNISKIHPPCTFSYGPFKPLKGALFLERSYTLSESCTKSWHRPLYEEGKQHSTARFTHITNIPSRRNRYK